MFVMTIAVFLQQAAAQVPEPVPAAAIERKAESEVFAVIRGAIASGRLDEATALIQLVDAPSPAGDEDELTLLKAELALERGATADAERLVASIHASPSLRCRVERVSGLALAGRNAADAAIDRLGTVAEDCRPDWRVWAALGKLLADRGEADGSRFAFVNALETGGERARVRIDLARALIKAGDLTAATEELQIASRIAPADHEVRQLLDFVAGMRGLEPERAAGDTDEGWARRLVDAAQGARQAERTSLSRALFSRALFAAPRYDEALLAEAIHP